MADTSYAGGEWHERAAEEEVQLAHGRRRVWGARHRDKEEGH
jgi:hypothetical protein